MKFMRKCCSVLTSSKFDVSYILAKKRGGLELEFMLPGLEIFVSSHYWINQRMGQEHHFTAMLKQRIHAMYLQEWMGILRQTYLRVQPLHLTSVWMSEKNTSGDKSTFDPQLLDILACPLSKKPLRYDESNNELVCDDLGVAYPIIDGIPNLNPVDGRLLKGKS